jgi:hypothetical protein
MAPQRACGSPLPARRRFLEAGLRASCGFWYGEIGHRHCARMVLVASPGPPWGGGSGRTRYSALTPFVSCSASPCLLCRARLASLLALMAIASRSRTSHSALKIALEK